jgi:hypothetical protein
MDVFLMLVKLEGLHFFIDLADDVIVADVGGLRTLARPGGRP